MKKSKIYQLNASFALVMFVMLGYLVKFFPETLSPFDSFIQKLIRSNMTNGVSSFWKLLTHFGSAHYVVIIVAILLVFLGLKKWFSEALFLMLNVVAAPTLVTILKYVYDRHRPNITHLVVENGLSFPSGHATVSVMLYITLMIIFRQRIKQYYLKFIPVIIAFIIVLLIGVSRIYLGVHYPTDILGGWLLSSTWILFWFPIYDKLRFKWRFKGVQK